tara:strand:- start:404 stop:1876 length:1473 start_codon:yes stop_codon:yes gene_type:complete
MIIKKYLVPFGFGLVGIFSFAPYSIKPLIFLSYAYLIREIVYRNKNNFTKLLFWSLGHWGFGMSWIIVSVYYYGNTGIALSIIIFISLILILTIVFSLPLLVLKVRLFNGLKYSKAYEILYVSSFFIISEWSTYYLLNGVPWIIPGIIFLDTITQNIYPILGVAGGSFIVYIFSNLIALFWDLNRRISIGIFIGLFVLLIPRHEDIQNNSDFITISIIQPSSDPFLKYTNGYRDKIENNLLRLASEVPIESKLVIFPEAELPYALESAEFSLFKEKLDQSKTIITGAWHFSDKKLFNSMVNLNSGQIYNKVHLVPFGEYIPFISSLRGLISFFDMPMSNVAHGKPVQEQMNYIDNKQINFSPLICYDIAFGNTVRKSNKSSLFIINISNDTWFGSSIGPHHHLDIARVRSIENNKWLVRATNDGFSAVIDNKGTIVDKLDKGISGLVTSRIGLINKTTIYNNYGYYFPYLLALIIVFLSAIIKLCSKRSF